jgi:TolA-binding protein
MRAILVGVVALVLASAGCIDKTGQSASYIMESRIEANRERLRDLDKDLSLERNRILAMEDRAAAARQRLADSGATLETFLEEMTRIRGEISEVGYALEEYGRMDEDLDMRLASLEVQLTHVMTVLDVPPAPAVLGRPPPPPVEGEPALDDVSPAAAFFREGLALVKAEEWDRARARLQKVVRDHPDSEWALEAQFLLARCLFELKRYKPSITEFQKVIEREEARIGADGEPEWAPRAMLMQGMAFEQLGTVEDLEAASLFFEELVRLYPGAPEAERARNKLEQLK